MSVSIKLGEPGAAIDGAQILITTPGYIKTKCQERKQTVDFSALKTIVYDEADELFIQDGNLPSFDAFFKVLSDIKVVP